MSGFSFNTVRDYLLDQGGRIEYHRLIKHFKHFLSDPSNQDARVKFKDYVNALATVQQDGQTKYLIIRPEYYQTNQASMFGGNGDGSLSPQSSHTIRSPSTICPPIPEHSIPDNHLTSNHNPYKQLNLEGKPKSIPAHEYSNACPPPVPDYHTIPDNLNYNYDPPPFKPPPVPTSYHPSIYNTELINPPIYTPAPVIPHTQLPKVNKNPPVIFRQQSLNDDPRISGSSIFSPVALAGQEPSPPQPPPRRKSLSGSSPGKSTNGATVFDGQKSCLQSTPGFDDEVFRSQESKETDPDLEGQPSQLKEIHELVFQTPGRVKERAQKLNKMASESELQLPPMPVNAVKSRGRDGKENRDNEDGDSGSLHPLDPLRRRWMVTASNCDYNGLIHLLKEDYRLASYKDFTSGYTALHWAAKFGKMDIIKLIAGSYGVDPNLRTHSGYTALHLAAIYNHEDVMQLLTMTYKANALIRDYSGKLAHQYLKSLEKVKSGQSGQRVKNSHSGTHNGSQHRRNGSSSSTKNQGRPSESVFIRIGSLNTRMRRTAAALTGIGVKTWGSAESLPDNNLMPPPSKNTFGRKKRNKKTASTLPVEVPKDSDSDSAYGFG